MFLAILVALLLGLFVGVFFSNQIKAVLVEMKVKFKELFTKKDKE